MTGFDASAILAVVGGVLLLPLLFIPYVAWSYRRGTVGPGHALLAAAAVIYAMALWTYTIIPLPSAQDLVCEDTTGMQLIPFAFLGDIRWGSGLLGDPALRQVLLNVVLFVPLGVVLRHLFGVGKVASIAVAAGVSLLIELTQLTGIWGLYDCAYRLFDTDDLLANTAGAALGVLLAPLAARLPGQHQRPPDQPAPVRPLRRLTAAAVDLVSFSLIGFVVLVGVAVSASLLERPDERVAELSSATATLAAAVVLLVLVPMRWGATLGQRLVFLRSVRPDDLAPPTPLQWGLRFLAGAGGYSLLNAASDLGLEAVGPLSTAWLVASALVIALVHTRGLSGYASGLVVVDSREPDLASRIRSRGVDPRRMSSAVLALGGALYVLLAVLLAVLSGMSAILPAQVVAIVMVLAALTLGLSTLALLGYVLYAGIVVIRREGRSAGNLLALLSVIATGVIVSALVLAFVTQWRWLIVTSVAGLGVSGYLGFLFGAFLLYGQVYGRATPAPGIDAVIVLGSRVFGDTVPPLLAARIDRGMQVHAAEVERGGRPLLVLSGGQGPDEAEPEGQVMARYAIEHGADPALVHAEKRATTTEENLTFSRQIIEQEGRGTEWDASLESQPDPDLVPELVVATNDFHAFRAAIIARELGVHAQVVGAPTAHYFFPSAIVREFVGVLARTPLRNGAAALAVAALAGGLAWLLTRF